MNLKFLNPGSDSTRDIYRMLSSISEKLNDPGFQATDSLSARENKAHRIDLIHATMQLEGIGLSRERTEWIMQRRPLRGLQYRIKYLPLEARIHHSYTEYFRVLTEGEKDQDPSEFILFILQMIDDLLIDLINPSIVNKTASDRILYFCKLNYQDFTRKDYMSVFKDISSATASRDLVKGVDAGLFEKSGTKNITTYKTKKN